MPSLRLVMWVTGTGQHSEEAAARDVNASLRDHRATLEADTTPKKSLSSSLANKTPVSIRQSLLSSKENI